MPGHPSCFFSSALGSIAVDSRLFSGRDEEWSALLAKYDLLNAACMVAWQALVAAYRPKPNGCTEPSPELMRRYKEASTVRMAAERRLLLFVRDCAHRNAHGAEQAETHRPGHRWRLP